MYFHMISLLAPLMRPHYYLDPGSGSFLIQLLIAGIAGAGLIIATSWRRIKALFTRSNTKEDDATPATKIEDDTNAQQ